MNACRVTERTSLTTDSGTLLKSLASFLILVLSLIWPQLGVTHHCEAEESASPNRMRISSISGILLDDMNVPLSQTSVSLYRSANGNPHIFVTVTKTDADGRYRFSEIPPTEVELYSTQEELIVQAAASKHEIGVERSRRSLLLDQTQITLQPPTSMPRSTAIQGIVVDHDDKPIKGISICDARLPEKPTDSTFKATTDVEGRFFLQDLRSELKTTGDSLTEPLQFLKLQHTVDLREGTPLLTASLRVQLARVGQIRGRVLDQLTGKPADSVTVTAQPTKQSSLGMTDCRVAQTTRTNAEGEYQFRNLPAVDHNVWATSSDRTCRALNSISVTENESRDVDDLKLVEGGWLAGRIQTLKGQPISQDPATGERLVVGLYGASRPRTGTSIESCEVDDDGRFLLRVAPGKNFPFLISPTAWKQVWRREKFLRGIAVEPGETVTVNFRMLEKPSSTALPGPLPKRDPVKLPPPVAEEWDAAENIRDLGGWYHLDSERHVVEINMVYHEAGGVRHDNKYVSSDDSLRIAAAFPRLKKLYLHQTQATDESMNCLVDLEGLEAFYVWSARGITDAGGVHLANLKNLTNIHLGEGKIGDGTLEVLSQLPNLSRMSLQGNQFTDAGLAHLSSAHQVRSLWIGMSKGKITDAGLAHLAGLIELEELDIQNSQITDEALQYIMPMRGLRSLYLSAAPVSAGGLAELSKERPELRINK